ncbi:hypothetical protein F3D3_0509 [Fusibacter sp. 3D3]|nr:hypothetical protein F3D3_0509 [Fusibacter sp. 3D3]
MLHYKICGLELGGGEREKIKNNSGDVTLVHRDCIFNVL